MPRETDAADSLGNEGSPEADRHLAENFGMTVRQVRDFDPQTLDVTRACKFLGLPLKRFDQLAAQPEARARWVETVARERKDLVELFPQASKELKEMLEAIRKFALRKCMKPDSPALVEGGGSGVVNSKSRLASERQKKARMQLVFGGIAIAVLVLVGGIAAVLMSSKSGPEQQATVPAGVGPGRAVQVATESTEKSQPKIENEDAHVPKGSGGSREGGGIPSAERGRWTSLFNGKDLTGWSVDCGDPKQWKTEGGVIVGTSTDYRSRNYLLSDRDYSDFALRFDFQIEGGVHHGGVALRAILGEKVPIISQQNKATWIADHPMIKLSGPDRQPSQDPKRYDLSGAALWLDVADAFHKPASAPKIDTGEWYRCEVVVKGDTCTATFNGKECVNLKLDPQAGKDINFTPGLKRAKGKVGFQINTGTLKLRNIEIEELGGRKQEASSPMLNPDGPVITSIDFSTMKPGIYPFANSKFNNNNAPRLPAGCLVECWKATSVAEFRVEELEGKTGMGITNLNDDLSAQIRVLKLGNLVAKKTYRARVEYFTTNDGFGIFKVRIIGGDFPTVNGMDLMNTRGKWKTANFDFVPPAGIPLDLQISNTMTGEGNRLTVRKIEILETQAIGVQPTPPPPRVEDLIGTWNSDFGKVNLETTKSGGISGYWIQANNKKGFITAGTFTPGTRNLTFSITQPWNNEKGSATFTLSADGTKLDGTWKHSSGNGKWQMTRAGK